MLVFEVSVGCLIIHFEERIADATLDLKFNLLILVVKTELSPPILRLSCIELCCNSVQNYQLYIYELKRRHFRC